ncbi:MAG TPA: hypothetical protein VEF76_07890 [Patescibacteria group bacterium]|nr:hypothetical protein [Patescibacteria group bacterium]
MSLLDNFRRSFTDPTLFRLLRIQFIKSTMTSAQKQAYEELAKQVDLRMAEKACDQQEIVVPADMPPRDAARALKLIKLEFDPAWDFHVTWAGEPGKQTMISEHRPSAAGVPRTPKPKTGV